MKHVWIVCFVLLCAWQSAYAGPRELTDSVSCGVVVVGATRVVEKEVPVEVLALQASDSVIAAVVYGSGQQGVFDITNWGQRNQQTTILNINVKFSPKAVAQYQTFIAIIVQRVSSLDTFLLQVSGVGIALRIEPERLDFDDLYIAQEDSQTRGLAIHNDGDVSVTVHVHLNNNSSTNPFSFVPLVDTFVIESRSALFLEVTCSAKGQIIRDVVQMVSDSLAVSVDGATGLPVQYAGLFARLIAPATNIDTLAFGNVLIGTSRRLSMSFTNTSGSVVSIERIQIDGAGGAFTYIDSVAARDILPGATLVSEIEFRPVKAGPSATDFTLFIWLIDQKRIPVKKVLLTGNGFGFDGPAVTTGTARVKIGDEFELPITARFNADQVVLLRNSNVKELGYEFTLQLNASIAKVLDDKVDSVSFHGANQHVHIVGAIPTSALPFVLPLNIRMRALLGDTDSSGVISADDGNIVGVVWSIPETDFIRKANLKPGAIVLTDVFIWPNGEKRLINSRKGALRLDLVPNPVAATGVLTISAIGFGSTAILTIYTPLGAEVYSGELMTSIPVTKQIRDLNIGAGTYYCRLTSGSNSLVKLLRVE